MTKTLKLHFESASKIPDCLKALEADSPVEFTWAVSGVNMRDVMTKPESLYCKAAVILTFASDEDCRAFMGSTTCQQTYQKYANEA